jgi:hypothetical protein
MCLAIRLLAAICGLLGVGYALRGHCGIFIGGPRVSTLEGFAVGLCLLRIGYGLAIFRPRARGIPLFLAPIVGVEGILCLAHVAGFIHADGD